METRSATVPVQTLSRIIPEDQLPYYLTDETMMTWMKAFTHETKDYNFNYEELEIMGDRVLELTFVDYLMQRNPNIKKNGISALKDRYMSKPFQRTLSRQLGFGDWIRVRDMRVNIHIFEDVFESFFGALFVVSNNISNSTFGYLNCYNMLLIIFNDVDINFNLVYGRGITQIKEMFEGLGWGQAIVQTNDTDYGILGRCLYYRRWLSRLSC